MDGSVVEQRIRPPRTRYLIALFVFLLGALPSAWILASGISGLTKGLIRAEGPGTTAIELDKPGTWTVFYEYRVATGPVTSVTAPDAPPMEVTLTAPSGEVTVMGASTGTFNYNTSTHSGVSIGSFRIDEPGSYELGIRYLEEGPEQVNLALGHEKGKATIKTIFGGIGIAVSGAIAFIIFIVVLILRVRSKSRLEQAAQGGET